MVIIDHRFTVAIAYREFLHRFRAGRGTGTATLEIKLLQQVAAFREEFLLAIFLDLHKSYDALDRSRFLGILEGYGKVPSSLCLIRLYWASLMMVAREGGYYGAPFRREREG